MLGIASDVGLHSSTHSMHLANKFDDRLSHPFHLPVSPFFGICYRLLHPFRCLNTLPVPISRKDCPFKVRFVFANGVDNFDKPSYLLWPNRGANGQFLLVDPWSGNYSWSQIGLEHFFDAFALDQKRSLKVDAAGLISHRSGLLLSHRRKERRLLK